MKDTLRKLQVLTIPILTLALSACQTAVPAEPGMEEKVGAEEMDRGPAGLPMVDPMAVSSDVIIAGNLTVYPLAERMAERFVDEGDDGSILMASTGSGAGLALNRTERPASDWGQARGSMWAKYPNPLGHWPRLMQGLSINISIMPNTLSVQTSNLPFS